MATMVDKEYTATEIIKKDLERGGFSKEEDKLLRALKLLIEQQKAVVVRHNNTVFVGIRKEPGVLEVHMYTLDSLSQMPEAMKVGLDALKDTGVKRLEAETDNPKIIAMLKTMGPLKVTKKGKKYAWSLDITK